MRAYEILTEGGNAFTDVGAVHISEIKPTLQWLAKKLGRPEIVTQTLGSVGKKEYSGDIDVVVDVDRDEMTALSDQLRKLLGEQSVRGVAGNIVTRVPIQNYDETKDERGPRTGYVQVDFFSGDPEWMRVYYHGPGDESKLKGVHRNILMAAIAEYVERQASKETDSFGRPVKASRWRWSPKEGLIKVVVQSKKNHKGDWAKKQDAEHISDPIRNADLIADKLFKGKADADALNSVETLIDAVKKAYSPKIAERIFKEFAERITRQGHAEGFEFPPEVAKHMKVQVTEAAKVGRPLQHLEDLVFIDGSKGAKQALDYLEHMASKAEGNEYTIKWDGMPALYWGRDKRGRFTLTGKNYWTKGDAGKPTSAEELYQMITSAGKQEAWRTELGASLRDIWGTIEEGTPKNFRGYLFGDLLFTDPPKQGDNIVFTPNKVTYTVPRDQELGEYLGLARVALAAHKWFKNFGDESGGPIPHLETFDTSKGTYVPTQNSRLAILGPYFAEGAVQLDTKELTQLRKYLSKAAPKIDAFLEGVPGLSNPAGEIYSFVNQQSRAGALKDFETRFIGWVETLGPKKQAQFKQKIESNPVGLTAMFFMFEQIMRLKNNVILQLDQQTPQVQTSVGKKKGGEGWVYKNVKLVPRDIWKLG